MPEKRFGVHIYSHKGTNWTDWYTNELDQHKAYLKALAKTGEQPTKKTPYHHVKKNRR